MLKVSSLTFNYIFSIILLQFDTKKSFHTINISFLNMFCLSNASIYLCVSLSVIMLKHRSTACTETMGQERFVVEMQRGPFTHANNVP